MELVVSKDKNIFNSNSRSFDERATELNAIEENENLRQEKERKNHNFVMMYRNHMPEMRWLMKKSGIAASIFNFIMEHMDFNNALICSNQVFMDYFEISASTVKRSIKLLADSGFLDILKSGRSNVYIINKEIVWANWENKKQYCQYNGKILISATENKDYEYRKQFDKFKQLREREKIK